MKNKFDMRLFNEMPVIGILRNYSFEEIEFIAPIYQEAGLTTLEITMNTDAAEEEIKYLSNNFPELNIGAGTVCTLADLDRVEKAGASFIVSPILDIRLIREANRKKLAVFPGAFSPTEIYQAWQAGATAVKIFPATMFGPKYVKEIKAPLNDIKLLPTGGVSPNNINEYFENGATGVGMGSSLFNKKFLQARDKEGLLTGFREIVELVKKAKEKAEAKEKAKEKAKAKAKEKG